MTDNNNKIFEDMARLAGSAVGTMAGFKTEIENFIRQRIESCMEKCNVVSREEFELVKEMLVKARMEQEILAKRLDTLEKKSVHKRDNHE